MTRWMQWKSQLTHWRRTGISLAIIGACGVMSTATQAQNWAKYHVKLQGSGPVFTHAMKPGDGTVRVEIENFKNLNVGYDLIDQKTKNVIANGTLADKGTDVKLGTAKKDHTYKLRLRCQEPPWNKTKCHASGGVTWVNH